MTKTVSRTIAVAVAMAMSSGAIAHPQSDDDKKDAINAGDAPTMGWMAPALNLGMPQPLFWSLFDPYLLDMPGGEGKGMPVYDANDTSKVIGYLKMPARKKPAGPVHCMIKETGLLAKSVDDCEAAGGSVAK